MTSLQQQILALLEKPSRDTYIALWEGVTTDPEYSPYSDPYNSIEQALDADDYETAQQQISQVIRPLLLSPRIHMLAAIVAKKLGDSKAAEFEQVFYLACIEGILTTGDGSQDSPYLVTRTSDEYDLLFHLKKELQMQSLMHLNDKSLDVMTCTDKSEICFDITRVIGSLGKR